MHAQDGTRATEQRAGRTPVKPPRGTTPPRPVPAGVDPRSWGAANPAAMGLIQGAAGNTVATAMVQRTQTAQETTAGPRSPSYEQTVAEYLAAGGPAKLYRSIRIESQVKRRQDRSTITASAEGNLGEGISAPREVARIYQTLRQWPEGKDIEPVDSGATFTVAHHVAGDNYGTQYISCTPSRERATSYSKYNFKAGPVENLEGQLRPRLVRHWAPVIEIDVSRLGSGSRLVNLGDPGIHGQTNLAETSEIGSMATNDQEVLIKGTIAAGAITHVYGVEDAIREMDLDARRQLIESEFSYGRRETNREEWDALHRRNVPEHLQQYFQHLQEEPEESAAAPSAASRRRPAPPSPTLPEEASEPAASKPAKKKKKPNKNLLSFDMDDE
ncbi:hypothetical protein [Streptomyces sp. SID13726]|uniref:hypothetical protein n=1 Tax=Streptomyces sp. SID13726 TaxID=2706058 RepID=UPI0013B6BD83|nr:hypothetical protein [Streptomyces sp. SID13726]NEB05158.1 hypothetical protein [Streptomyces sp. SID13726]